MEKYTIDAKGKRLGRIATDAAHHLMGKHRTDFAKNVSAELTIPMHYDMFSINTGDVNEFINIAEEKDLTYRILQPSELMLFNKECEKCH